MFIKQANRVWIYMDLLYSKIYWWVIFYMIPRFFPLFRFGVWWMSAVLQSVHVNLHVVPLSPGIRESKPSWGIHSIDHNMIW